MKKKIFNPEKSPVLSKSADKSNVGKVYRGETKYIDREPKKQRNYVVVGESFPHFRKYKKANHPALIVGEIEPDEYKYRKVMHTERDGRHINEKVDPNPDPTDKRPMYIAHRIRHDKKKFFGKKYPWKYPPKNKG